jgi:hypothetical protein
MRRRKPPAAAAILFLCSQCLWRLGAFITGREVKLSFFAARSPLAADISYSNYFFIAPMASIASSRKRRSSAFRSPCTSGSCLAASAVLIKM